MNDLRGFIQFFKSGTLLCCLYIFAYAENSDFYFVQITDTHWGYGDNLERTKSVVDGINSLPMKVGFVVHTGDITNQTIENQSLIDSGLTIIRKLKYPIYFVPGNCDILEHSFKQTSDAFVKNFGKICSRIEFQNVSIITLCNLQIKDSSGNKVYDPIIQLDSLLKIKPKNTNAIIFQHCPITDDFYKNEFHPGLSIEEKNKFQKICESGGVSAIISGHFHRDEFQLIGPIPLFVSPPVSGSWGRQSSFRVYHYENGKISYFSQYL